MKSLKVINHLYFPQLIKRQQSDIFMMYSEKYYLLEKKFSMKLIFKDLFVVGYKQNREI